MLFEIVKKIYINENESIRFFLNRPYYTTPLKPLLSKTYREGVYKGNKKAYTEGIRTTLKIVVFINKTNRV